MAKLYEGMFLVESNRAKENFEAVEAECQTCVTRHGGKIVRSEKWDDRRLAYEIKRVKRATFLLIHFEAEGEAITRIERQCQMSETVLRVMITVDEDGLEVNLGAPAGDRFDSGGRGRS